MAAPWPANPAGSCSSVPSIRCCGRKVGRAALWRIVALDGSRLGFNDFGEMARPVDGQCRRFQPGVSIPCHGSTDRGSLCTRNPRCRLWTRPMGYSNRNCSQTSLFVRAAGGFVHADYSNDRCRHRRGLGRLELDQSSTLDVSACDRSRDLWISLAGNAQSTRSRIKLRGIADTEHP